ncbi:phosphomannomutase [Rhizobium halophilum]|uniref:phosphomannomutase n=1 Tax=Rhizobium halophilum TaxID=2846852 RepID=UPI001EFE061E|nr:phosphomannomutase [Rhizobium halophilum]MCF6369608.1 phosphomannomutase [Rhizobium halophilum]
MKFGTSGLRGLSSDLKGPASYRYAAAFGRYLLESGKAKPGATVLLGRDFRDSSPEISFRCANALRDLSFDVVDCGTVPTPALALHGLETQSASLMVTGSHIPADRNGIKFYRPDGEIDKDDEAAISALVASIDDKEETRATTAVGMTDELCTGRFLERNKMLLPVNALSGFRVGVYQHSTVARDLLVEVLAHYGAEVLSFGRSDTFIPVDTEAVGDDTRKKLRAWAADYALDAIVSADGDGDRPLVADETGAPIRGDIIGLITAHVLDADVVVTPVTSNSGIEAAGRFDVRRTRVGSPYVIAGMNEAVAAGKKRVVGFEANGGVLLGSDFMINGTLLKTLPTRDCFLPILSLLSYARERRMPLSAVVSSFDLPVAASDRLENFPVETSEKLMASLRTDHQALPRFLAPIGEVENRDDLDGLRVTLKGGRIIHLRPSGNAPEMRCYVEAQTEEAATALLEAGLNRLRQWPNLPPET